MNAKVQVIRFTMTRMTRSKLLDEKVAQYRARSASRERSLSPTSLSQIPAVPLRRMPSSEALRRSNHNDTDNDESVGSQTTLDSKEKFTIVSLKRANADLSSKTAEMEADFMNQCDTLSSENLVQAKLIKELEKKNAAFELKVSSQDSKMMGNAKELKDLRDESSFQKQAITDLKNQLYQLQEEVEDTEYQKSKVTSLYEEKTKEAEVRVAELEKECASMMNKVDQAYIERDQAKIEVLALKKKVGRDNGDEEGIEVELPEGEEDRSFDSSPSEVLQNWKQLEETKDRLESTSKLLHETQSSLATLEHEHKRLQRNHEVDIETKSKQMQLDVEERMEELRSMLQLKDDTIRNQEKNLEKYSHDLKVSKDNIEQLNARINQLENGLEETRGQDIDTTERMERLTNVEEHYKTRVDQLEREMELMVQEVETLADEAENKNEKEVDKTEIELNEVKHQLDSERALTSSLTEKYEQLSRTVQALEQESNVLRATHGTERIVALEDEIEVMKATAADQKRSQEMLLELKQSRVDQLENELRMKAGDINLIMNPQMKEEGTTLHKIVGDLNEALSLSKQSISELETDLSDKSKKIEELKQRLKEESKTSIRKEMNGKDNNLEKVKEIEKLNLALAEKEENIALLREQSTMDIGKLKRQLDSVLSSNGDLKDMLSQKETELGALRLELESELKSSSLTQIKVDNDISALKEQLEAGTRKSDVLSKDLKIKLSMKDIEITKAKVQLDEELKNIVSLKEDLEDVEAEKNTLENELENAHKIVESMQDSLSKREESFEKEELDHKRNEKLWEEEKMSLKNKLQETCSELEALSAKTTSLKEEVSRANSIQQNLKKDIEERRHDTETQRESFEAEKITLSRSLQNANTEIKSLHERMTTLREESLKLSDIQHELNDAKVSLLALEEEAESLRKENGALKEGTGNSAFGNVKRTFYLSMEKKYKKEIAALERETKEKVEEFRTKLSDRDKTIAVTAKASVSQEQKIKSLKARISDVEDGGTLDGTSGSGETGEVLKLRQNVKHYKKTQYTLSMQISSLKKQISDMKTESHGTYNTFHSSELKRQLRECQEKLRERDGAISTLVKSSITQEQQITSLREEVIDYKSKLSKTDATPPSNNGPTWEAFSKVQQESEIFAGQLIEQDEENEILRQQLEEQEDMLVSSDEILLENEGLRKELEEQFMIRDDIERRNRDIQGNLQNRVNEEMKYRKDLEWALDNLKSKIGSQNTSKRLDLVQEELKEVEEMNSQLREDAKELRKKLRAAQNDMDRLPEVETELMETRQHLESVKKKHPDEMMQNQLKLELNESIEQRTAISSELLSIQSKLQDEKSKFEALVSSGKEKESELQSKLDKMMQEKEGLEKEIEAQRSLKSITIKEKEAHESLKLKLKAMEDEAQEQNDVVHALSLEVKKLRDERLDSTGNSDDIIAALTLEVKKLRSAQMSHSDSDDIIAALTEEVKKLRKQSHSPEHRNNDSDEIIAALTEEVKELHNALNSKHVESDHGNIEATIREEFQEEMYSIRKQKEFLGKEVARLQKDLDSGFNESEKLKELKKQVVEAEEGRTKFEKTMIASYERKLSLMQMNKDVTIDGLRKELSQRKGKQKEMESELLAKIRSLESENKEIEAEINAKMQHKNAKIGFLEQTLNAHKQVSGNMRDELDQLQNGMETASVTRRAEVEELQEDLVSVQSKATKYQREITTLKMKIEDHRLQHQNEVTKLQATISSLEADTVTPTMRDVQSHRDQNVIREMSGRVESLTIKVRSLQEENNELREKFKTSTSRQSKNDKWRNSALQEQVFSLEQRLRDYGDNGSVASASSRKTSRSVGRSPLRIPQSPVVSNSSVRKRSSGGSRDDISTYTEGTF